MPSSEPFLHGTGRVASSVPRTTTVPKNTSVVRPTRSRSIEVEENPREELVTIKRNSKQTVHVHASHSKQADKEKPRKPKVVGADVDLQPIKEPFRNRTEDSKTTTITAKSKYSDDSFGLDCDEVLKLLEDGPIKFRFVVIAGAAFMVIASLIDYNEQKYYSYYRRGEVTPLFFMISLYVWIFGAFIITLEVFPFHMGMSAVHKFVLDQLNILRFTWGRGLFYIFSGSLQFCLFTKWNMIAGGVMMFLGLCSVVIGRMASTKLKKLLRNINNKTVLRERFARCDRDKDGHLNLREFKQFARETNVKLTDNELDNAFVAIDEDNDRYLSFTDVAHWYASAKYHVHGDSAIV